MRCVCERTQANVSYATTASPAMFMEAQTDVVVMSLHDALPVKERTPQVLSYMKAWSANMTSALHLVAERRPDYGVFNPACLTHTSFGAQKPIIDNHNFYQALGDWMFGRVPTGHSVYMDDCGILCNPTCPPTELDIANGDARYTNDHNIDINDNDSSSQSNNLLEDPGLASLVLLTDDVYAKCLDGTSAGFYFRPALDKKFAAQWVFSLEGGGECVGHDDCTARAKTGLGSSSEWNSTMYLGQLQDPHSEWNPDYYGYNQVFIKYCSGDLHSGQRTVATSDTYGLYFSGHHNVKGTLDYLKLHHGLAKADLIVWSGDSAGGIGSFLHLDFAADTVSSASVYGAPIAGFYFPSWAYTGPDHERWWIDFTPSGWHNYTLLWDSFVPWRCAQSVGQRDAWSCIMANVSYATTASPAMFMEAQTDVVVMSLHDALPVKERTPQVLSYMKAWSANMTSALHLVAERRPDYGVFNPACLTHTSFGAQKPIIDNHNFYQALGDWMFGRVPTGHSVYMDDCGILCNPTCPPTELK
eukprot:CAMPEP_0175833388 /NCGR_PEP_ID=MMETSP0107_2-20121207/15483_1 /TAXON_ID=195067 ORGANISM="Goniomonas pacifica, Strain CCMP1869" /NCGR_SAMPLE_ID=MMETSP0107_2 /ASSEMBLY_ACC=CAM_ASM_000203 /LENGTH=527 /DNA_ID=CAMNT_0017146513 /DNA_START=109 /DNA_END=1692 /DNA_ORIENTATION=-